MALEDKIEAVKKIDKALKNKSVEPEPEIERVPPNKEKFDALMSTEQNRDTIQAQKTSESLAVEKTSPAPSILDQVRNINKKINNISQLSPEDLRNQVRDVISRLDTVKGELAGAEGIKPSYQKLMHNRLTHIDDNIRVALSKAGVEYKPDTTVSPLNNTQLNPLDRFLGFITHGQYQLEHLSTTIGELSKHGQAMTPVDMMRMQIKVGLIQQEIELFTSMLNKALESTKTLMNVQV